MPRNTYYTKQLSLKEIWQCRREIEIKARAKKLGLPFTIKASEIPTPDTCEVLGTPLLYQESGLGEYNLPTVDRVIPKLGYVPGNVATISKRANRLKTDASLAEVIAIAEYVLRHVK